MTQEDKGLLLHDLCARLPYGIKLDFYSKATKQHYVSTLLGIEPDGDRPIIAKVEDGAYTFIQDHIKPYLRPMSDMTEDEKEKYCELQDEVLYSSGRLVTDNIADMVDWLNSCHFDWRGLIPKGLALAATENMYNIK